MGLVDVLGLVGVVGDVRNWAKEKTAGSQNALKKVNILKWPCVA